MNKSHYRNPESYTSKDPEKRARQLSNLKRERTKGSVKALKTPENDPYDSFQLHRMAIDFRYKTKRPISRSDILRALIDLIEDIDIVQALDKNEPVGADDTTNDILKAVFAEKIKSS